MALGWTGFRKFRRLGAELVRKILRQERANFVDFGERAIVDAMKNGGPAFSYAKTEPEKLIARPLSPKEREHSRKSSLGTQYVPTVPARSRF